MADINTPVIYSAEISRAIAAKQGQSDFVHSHWSCEELKEVRRFIRNHYRKEQGGLCAYCKNAVSLHSAMNCHVEHVVPKSLYKDFIFIAKNLCVICADCNEIKSNQEACGEISDTLENGEFRKLYPRSSNAFKIVHPHFDDYDSHIKRLGPFYYLDRSDKGSFTITVCKLNRHLRNFGWEAHYDEADVMDAAARFLESEPGMDRVRAFERLKDAVAL